MTYADRPAVAVLKRLCTKHGVSMVEVAQGHFHLRKGDSGPFTNYWPESHKRTVHVQGAKESRKHCSEKDAVDVALRVYETLGARQAELLPADPGPTASSGGAPW